MFGIAAIVSRFGATSELPFGAASVGTLSMLLAIVALTVLVAAAITAAGLTHTHQLRAASDARSAVQLVGTEPPQTIRHSDPDAAGHTRSRAPNGLHSTH